jgi:hypothetical protein
MCRDFDYSVARRRRFWRIDSVLAALLSVGSASVAIPASQAFTADIGTAGSHQPLILPFHIGKPGTGKTSEPNPLPQSESLSPQMKFNMMGWPWLKENSGVAQPSPQQINADLQAVLAGMSSSARRLKAADAGAGTQAVQKKIIARLDQLIKIAEQSQGKSGGQQKNKSQQQQSMSMQQSTGNNTSPMTPSHSAKHSYIPGGGVMNPGSLKSFISNKRQWGNLPARERNMILNALRHQTLPQYQSLVRQYYESLAKLNQRK